MKGNSDDDDDDDVAYEARLAKRLAEIPDFDLAPSIVSTDEEGEVGSFEPCLIMTADGNLSLT